MIDPETGFALRSAADLAIVHEVYRDDCYDLGALDVGPEPVVVDVGAHIGTFARAWWERHPDSRIACVEACPENLPALRENAGDFARLLAGAVTYLPGPVALREGRESWAGRVVPAGEGGRPVVRWTLEAVLAELGADRIDVLKLDCEGSEFDILEHAPLARIRYVIGEYHDLAWWDELRAQRFAGWEYRELHVYPALGVFQLRNPAPGCGAERS